MSNKSNQKPEKETGVNSKNNTNLNNKKNAGKTDEKPFGLLGTIVTYIYRFFRWFYK